MPLQSTASFEVCTCPVLHSIRDLLEKPGMWQLCDEAHGRSQSFPRHGNPVTPGGYGRAICEAGGQARDARLLHQGFWNSALQTAALLHSARHLAQKRSVAECCRMMQESSAGVPLRTRDSFCTGWTLRGVGLRSARRCSTEPVQGFNSKQHLRHGASCIAT